MYKLMKIKDLKYYGIPSYVVNIWEKDCSPYLLPLQEEAVRNYLLRLLLKYNFKSKKLKKYLKKTPLPATGALFSLKKISIKK